ncbi:MAG: hypothetical protein ACKVPX_14290 [Myxococcaceae bacterium]
MNSSAAVKQYSQLMEDVKIRIATIMSLSAPPLKDKLPGPIQIESVYLQFRKILELIAMGSLLTNKELYAEAAADFAKHWHAGRILERLKSVNPHFYPQPVVDAGGNHLVPASGGLTMEEFADLYKACGRALHSANPFGAPLDYRMFAGAVSGWLGKIIALLNMHKLHFFNDDGFWLIQMKTHESDLVHFYRFNPVATE